MEQLIDTLEAIGTPRIILVGDFMLDEYIYGDVERISPEAPVPVLHVNRRESRPGGAGNVASMIRSLNGTVQCVGVIGQDIAGEQLTDLLKSGGAQTDGLVRVNSHPTVRKTRYVGLAQHKNPHQILRVDDENKADFEADIHKKLLSTFTQKISAGDCVVIQDHNKGVLAGGSTAAMIDVAKQLGCKVVVDPALIKDYSRYRGATLLSPNRYEAQLATGVEISGPDSLAQACAKIVEITDAEFVVITLDREGSFLYRKDNSAGGMIPAVPHEVADGTGAGDAVISMLALAVSAECEPEKAVMLANVAGGLEVERFGVMPISREEIRDELRKMIGLRRSKVIARDKLALELARLRRAGATVVFTNGCFDLMHMGHVQYLQQARQQGSCLVVAINSDASVQKLKGPLRPIINQDERAKMLAALECIDYVTIFDEETPEALLEILRPEILVKGGSTDVIVGQGFVESYGGQVRRLDLVQGRSTTDIINRIIETHDNSTGEKE